MSQPSTDDSQRFGSHDEWRGYWGTELLQDMNITAPLMTCAMCGSPANSASGFCSDGCEAEHGGMISG